jgi:hypothetical protein
MNTMKEDTTQAQRMWTLRVQIDVWSTGIDESIRVRNRDLLIDAYLRLPSRRVWLFVKYARFTIPFCHEDKDDMDKTHVLGPEDTVARGEISYILLFKLGRLLTCNTQLAELSTQAVYQN